MLYIQQSLGPDEELIHIGKFHWVYNLKAMLAILWGGIFAILTITAGILVYRQFGWFPDEITVISAIRNLHVGIRIFAFFMFVIGVFSFAQMMIIKATTEIAITNKRLVFKKGLVARQVVEMSTDRIESVNVLQSILGRILNYGRLAVRGMGVGEVILPPIEEPIAFRQAIEKARSK